MKLLKHITDWILPIGLGILPVVFLPLTYDFYETNKWALLMLITMALCIIWIIRAIRKSGATLTLSWSTIGFGVLLATSIASMIIASPNKIEAFIHPFGVSTFLALTLIFSLRSPANHDTITTRLLWIWYAGVGVLGLLGLYQLLGLGKILFPTSTFIADPAWTPTGSALTTIAILIVTLPLVVEHIFHAIHKKSEHVMALSIALALVILIGLGSLVWLVFPKLATSLLPIPIGWSILLEVAKSMPRALTGVGAENFLFAFTTGKPLGVTASAIGALRFGANASTVLHLGTIYGLGTAVGILAIIKVLILGKKSIAERITGILATIALFSIPPSLSLLTMLAVILLLTDHDKPIKTVSVKSIVAQGAGVIVGSALVILLGYTLTRTYIADMYFYQSLQAARRNDGTGTYNLGAQAILWNPGVSQYHVVYSQTNLALADTLIGQQQDITDPTEQQKNLELINQLIQQAIRESKFGVTLAPMNVTAWENIAHTYQSLTNIATGADKWATGAFEQAVRLDPYNPTLRIELGNMYLKEQKIDDAIAQMTIAIQLAPEFANAYYNLANAYRQKGQYDLAIEALKKTIALVGPGEDNNKAQLEIDAIEKEKKEGPAETPTPTPTGTPRLNLPSPTPTPQAGTNVPSLTLP